MLGSRRFLSMIVHVYRIKIYSIIFKHFVHDLTFVFVCTLLQTFTFETSPLTPWSNYFCVCVGGGGGGE